MEKLSALDLGTAPVSLSRLMIRLSLEYISVFCSWCYRYCVTACVIGYLFSELCGGQSVYGKKNILQILLKIPAKEKTIIQ